MSEVYLVSAVRTPIGRGSPDGALYSFSPSDLASSVISEAARRAAIPGSRIEDVIFGAWGLNGDWVERFTQKDVLQDGNQVHAPVIRIDRMYGSGQQAIHFAAQAILSGDMNLVIAGGVGMASRSHFETHSWLSHNGRIAEMIAKKCGLSREALDNYAHLSQHRAMNAIQSGWFDSQILPLGDGNNAGIISRDEELMRIPDGELMPDFPSVFTREGVFTSSNSCQPGDGAAAVLLASPAAVGRYNLTPRARIIARVVTGSNPNLPQESVISATKTVLRRADLDLEQIDIVEIDEIFAPVVLAWVKEFSVDDLSRINPNGGAIALGHPLSAAGAVLTTKLIYELERSGGRFGLQITDSGDGTALAMIVERL